MLASWATEAQGAALAVAPGMDTNVHRSDSVDLVPRDRGLRHAAEIVEPVRREGAAAVRDALAGARHARRPGALYCLYDRPPLGPPIRRTSREDTAIRRFLALWLKALGTEFPIPYTPECYSRWSRQGMPQAIGVSAKCRQCPARNLDSFENSSRAGSGVRCNGRSHPHGAASAEGDGASDQRGWVAVPVPPPTQAAVGVSQGRVHNGQGPRAAQPRRVPTGRRLVR